MGKKKAKSKDTLNNFPEESLNNHASHDPVILTENDCKPLLYRSEDVITETCESCGYDVQNIKPSNWNYILYQIAEKVFKPFPEIIRSYNHARSDFSGMYLLDNIDLIYDTVYSPLCSKYGQIIGIYPFCQMLGIKDYNVVHQWEIREKVTSKQINIRKKISLDREESLRNAMLSSNTNPVKFLAIGNHEYAWNESKPEVIQDNKPVIDLNALPELSDNLMLPDLTDDSNEN